MMAAMVSLQSSFTSLSLSSNSFLGQHVFPSTSISQAFERGGPIRRNLPVIKPVLSVKGMGRTSSNETPCGSKVAAHELPDNCNML